MHLLKTIQNYGVVDLNATATHVNGAELGDRIDMNPEEGHVEKILLVHTFTETVDDSGPISLRAIAAPTATSTVDTAHAVALTSGFIPEENETGAALDFTSYDNGDEEFMIAGQFWGKDSSEHTPVFPFITFILGISDASAGIFTTVAYLYGDPNKYSEMPHGTVV